MNRVKSEVPTMSEFMPPILKWASKRSGGFTLREATEAMARHFKLSPKAVKELTGKGNIDRVYDRTSWSINPHLKEAGLVHSIRWGYWTITVAGKKVARTSKEKQMTTRYLKDNFPSYRRWAEEAARKRAMKRKKQLERE